MVGSVVGSHSSCAPRGLTITPLLRTVFCRRYTPTTHPDHAPLSRAADLVSAVTSKLNAGVSRSEGRARLAELQAAMAGSGCPVLVAPHREIVREGDLQKVHSSSGGHER
jgi:hypothetical protein